MTEVNKLNLLISEEEEEEEEEEELTPEQEVAEEEKDLAEVKTEELREKLAEDLGIDPESESELLDKVVDRETEHRSKLSKTIKQKINWREKANKPSEKPNKDDKKPDEDGKKPMDAEAVSALVSSGVNEALEADRLRSLSLPEAIETEVKELAKVRNIPVGEAAKLPYIQSRIEEVEREERIKNSSPSRKNKGTYKSNIDPSKPLKPEDFDLSSKEGRKDWNDAKAARRAHSESK